ncbi:uncharacterized protein OCT59_017214 [Rhizophagus irregularis]|uniref:uncharacterized protein n=1 Tax=Rhizophagus irregularis TaxID=588596 RepID=UPI0019E7A376|nr:hypothetical protein OCT59_017214 [Rhizophagus irregularis]GET56565.1 hypothetical protein GLOIN_2v1642863 [Rhizophagus irregularis DAOM 181602=DAOM 197198]
MGEKAENVDYAEEDADGSISQSLARLYQKATRAGLRVAKANQDEIFLCWSRVYCEVAQHHLGITETNLRKITQKARRCYLKPI